MTARPELLSRTDRKRLLDRLDELAGFDREMREGGTRAGPDEPVPLHRLPPSDRQHNAYPPRPAPGRTPPR